MEKWNLKNIYTSFEDEKIENDFSSLEKKIRKAKKSLKKDFKNPDEILDFYKIYNNILAIYSKLSAYASLSYSVDTSESKAINMLEKVEKYDTKLIDLNLSFAKSLKSTRKKVLSDKSLATYSFNIKENINNAKYMLSEKEENIISSMKSTSSNSASKLHSYAVSSLTCEYRNETIPISNIRNLAYSDDANVRKDAYISEMNALEKIAHISASALNDIKGEVIFESKLRGYSSPLEMTLLSSRMDKKTLDALIISIEKYLPVFRKYLKAKAKLLGHSSALPFYDLFAPIAKSSKTYSYDEAKDFVVKNFSEFNPKLGKFAKNAMDNNWIDPFPRVGKVSGAFCHNLPFMKESRIMCNFTGNFNDVSTLAHELGHAYHGENLHNNKMVNTSYPMPLAETASIFCETIIENSAIKLANNEEILAILENSISGSCQVIVDIYSRYLFETSVFEHRKNGSISVEMLNKLMLEAQKKAYGDGLDENYLHKYMWVIKPHYYEAAYNFYNFPYAFGLLFAKGLYSMYLKKGEKFLGKYDKILNYTGTHNIREALKFVGMDSRSTEFYNTSLEIIKNDVDKFLEIVDEK